MESGADINPLFEAPQDPLMVRARGLLEEKPWFNIVLRVAIVLIVIISISIISIAGAYAYWKPSFSDDDHWGPGPVPGPEVIPTMRNHSLPKNAASMTATELLEEMFCRPLFHACAFPGYKIFGYELILGKENGGNITFGPAYSKGKKPAKMKVAQDACNHFWKFHYADPANLVTDLPEGSCSPLDD